MTTTSHDRDDISEDGDWPTLTHADGPIVDEDSAAVAAVALEELTLLRLPGALGDCLADLHAMASLVAQLRHWIPLSVSGARDQGHSWSAIAAQLEITMAEAKSLLRDHIGGCAPPTPEEDSCVAEPGPTQQKSP
jgi:hypothetical protein